MFKFGVYSIKQLEKGKTRTFFGATKKISVSLLDDIRKNDMISDAYASLMYNLSDDRGSFKRTYRSRFDNFDNRCIDTITKNFSAPDIQIHDVAISSGETAVDFFRKLQSRYRSLSYFATDYDPYLTVIRQRALAVSLTSNGSIVQLVLPPFVFTPKKPDRLFYPINRLLCYLVLKFWAKRLLNMYKEDRLPLANVQKVNLFCPQALTLANRDSRFKLGQYDILSSADNVFDCIRAMNVLNQSYFSGADFHTILRNFHEAIRENGLLIVGSNTGPGSPVSGAIYSRSHSTFDLIWSSETKPTIDKHVGVFNKQRV